MVYSQYITWIDIENTVEIVSKKILNLSKNFSSISTVSRGGLIPSRLLADSLGIEKIIINTAAFLSPQLVLDLSKISGSQSVVVSVDVRKSLFGKDEVYVNNGRTKTKISPVEYAKRMQELGAGELIVSSIDRDGTGKGYDIAMLKSVVDAVQIPVVGLGGASTLQDVLNLKQETNVSGIAAGDLFVFQGKHKAVLITYPNQKELKGLFK